MSQIQNKREKISKDIRNQMRQQTFYQQRQWTESLSLLTMIPFLIDQENTEQFDEFLDSIITSQDMSILSQGLSKYINQKYEKLMMRKYYWNGMQVKKDIFSFDKDTFLVINLLRLKMRIHIASKADINLVKIIIKQDNQICLNELKQNQKCSQHYLDHYTNMTKLIIDLVLFFEEMEEEEQKKLYQNDLINLIIHQLELFSFIHCSNFKSKNQNSKNFYSKVKNQFNKIQPFYLTIFSSDNFSIFQSFFYDKITTSKKTCFFKKLKELFVIAYDSFYYEKQLQIIRCLKIFQKLINQISSLKLSSQSNQALSIEYKNQIFDISNQFIQLFDLVLCQIPIQNIKSEDKNWGFSQEVMKIIFYNFQNDKNQVQNAQNVKQLRLECLSFYILKQFNKIEYRMLIQMLKFLASAFSYSDKLISKMMQIKYKQNLSKCSIEQKMLNQEISRCYNEGLNLQFSLGKLMKHVSTQVRLNTFWLISNISGSQINYHLSFPFLIIIFQEQLLFWESNHSLRQQLFIIVLNYLCNIKSIQQFLDFELHKLINTQSNDEKLNQSSTQALINKNQPKTMMQWTFQVLSQALSLVNSKFCEQSLIQRIVFALYNMLDLQNNKNDLIKGKICSYKIDIFLNQIYNELPKSDRQTLDMIQKGVRMYISEQLTKTYTFKANIIREKKINRKTV